MRYEEMYLSELKVKKKKNSRNIGGGGGGGGGRGVSNFPLPGKIMVRTREVARI